MKFMTPKFEIITRQLPEKEMLRHIERIARVAYKSEGKITEDSALSLVRRLIDSGHESTIEHIVISVLVTCDRGVSHEAVRHRIASYTQESTRYCNYGNVDKFGAQIAYIDLSGGLSRDRTIVNLTSDQVYAIYQEWQDACEDAERHYLKMIELGASPQIARSVLNNSTKTEIVMTMNLREWRHFFKLRAAKDAHPQMREIACPMLRTFAQNWPTFFSDLLSRGEGK